MKKPPNGTHFSIEVVEKGLEIGVHGSKHDVIMSIVAAMDGSERIEEILMAASKEFMLHKISDRYGEDELGHLLKQMADEMGDHNGSTEDMGVKKPYDFSGVEDLLTKEEKDQLG